MPYAITTPEHGTAFDIVGKGIAKTKAMEEAHPHRRSDGRIQSMNL